MLSWLHDVIAWLPVGLPSFLVVLAIIIIVHEMGHFLVARACGVAVKTFSIGFGGEIFGWNDRKGTRWKVCWLPFGGYVMFAGDAGAASTPDPEAIAAMSEEERKSAFHLKPLWQRAAVTAAGPVANFLLAFVVLVGLYGFGGIKALSTEIGEITKASPAAAAGLKTGDRIVAVNGKPITMFVQLQVAVTQNKTKPMTLTVERGGHRQAIGVVPRLIQSKDIYGTPVAYIGLGIAPAKPTPENMVSIDIPPQTVPIAAAQKIWDIVDTSLTYIGRLVAQKADTKNLSGPIGIAGATRDAAQSGLYIFISLIAFISVSIGLINLFPIPLLDGGHLLYYAFEAVLGRPLKEEVQEVGFKVGLALVLGLMIFAAVNDLVR